MVLWVSQSPCSCSPHSEPGGRSLPLPVCPDHYLPGCLKRPDRLLFANPQMKGFGLGHQIPAARVNRSDGGESFLRVSHIYVQRGEESSSHWSPNRRDERGRDEWVCLNVCTLRLKWQAADCDHTHTHTHTVISKDYFKVKAGHERCVWESERV